MLGFGISGYRGFGPDAQLIAPLTQINIFVGQNNVGKSNVLRALHGVAALAVNPKVGSGVMEENAPHRGREAPYTVMLPVPLSAPQLDEYLAARAPRLKDNQRAQQLVRTILSNLPLSTSSLAWFAIRPPTEELYSPHAKALRSARDATEQTTVAGVNTGDWRYLWSSITGNSGGDFQNHHIPQTLDALSPFGRTPPLQIHEVEPHRQIGAAGSNYEGLNGAGLISRLAELERPAFKNRDADLAKFERINAFVQEVSGSPNARLTVANGATELMVAIDGKVLPIQLLGTGIHEVIIFAAAATAYDNVAMCLEEPEIHLHPRLQRRLLSYLRDETSNQYFITTHSAHLLDCRDASVFHVELNEHAETTIRRIEAPGMRATACFDLGYRPSDLVQANCIVWVEGPSDRVYVNAWLKAADPELREGEHYSVMFYGGRLLSHLTMTDEDVTEFIELQRLNRRVAILIDSDKRSSRAKIGDTKQRVADEVKRHGGFTWITAGREIENYVAVGTLEEVLARVHSSRRFEPIKDQWSCVYENTKGERTGVDKLRIARLAVERIDFGMLDLRERVDGLVGFIRDSNDKA